MAPLKLSDVGVSYPGRQVLSAVTFTVNAGDLWAVVGPNGAGKSSLVRALVGLTDHTGTIEINGVNATTLTAQQRSREVTWVPQELPSDVQFSALEVVLMGRHGLSWQAPTAEEREAARDALVKVGLPTVADQPVHQLSGGERRRVWLARAFFSGQKVLILDEPTAFLDVAQQRSILKRVKSETEKGLACVAVVHDLSLIAGIASHVLLLKNGKVVACGPASEVMKVETVSAVFDTRMTEVSPGIFMPE